MSQVVTPTVAMDACAVFHHQCVHDAGMVSRERWTLLYKWRCGLFCLFVQLLVTASHSPAQMRDGSEGGCTSYPAPLELKTGRMMSRFGSPEHRAQVSSSDGDLPAAGMSSLPSLSLLPLHDQVLLYCLMLSDRNQQDIPGGLLYYMKGQHTQGVPALSNEIRSLLHLRKYTVMYIQPVHVYIIYNI